MSKLSGLASRIRGCSTDETFDLAGQDAASILQTITDAFAEPFKLEESVRITFVVGAGKLARQKYDSKAGQTLTNALRQLYEYEEDRAASKGSQGCFKSQHDTGKNLFTVVVYPRLAAESQAGPANDDDRAACHLYPIPLPLVEGTPLHAVLLSSEGTFEQMASKACQSWSQKKNCLEAMKVAIDMLQQMDSKLIGGSALTEAENAFYDETGGMASLEKKGDIMKSLMSKQVTGGQLTADELSYLQKQVSDRIASLQQDIDSAVQLSQDKKASKFTAQMEKATERRKMLEKHTPQAPLKLKHEAQIATLKKQLRPLLTLEAGAKGRMLTLKETKELAAKDEILAEIEELEWASQGWFEDDESFEIRLEACRKRLAVKSSSSKKSTSASGKGRAPGTGSRTAGKNTTWLTPGNSGLAAKSKAAKKNKPKSSGGVFAAMMLDSDSDSD
ncbi:hypothetical protein THAOC_35987 [Thalassiosira oceanica]|uniref:Uncharacterized protein n=1 Tax=Thalassiosira oceanica TaxID=159749 RepID=K0RFP0_THAOC|nr:hypothetical protein THAOC_35987 [Thalassiosira oceanica]|eukprot:EJK45402.1 hypothetical protein THAOC_35987 [Thalassiosira oceanica]